MPREGSARWINTASSRRVKALRVSRHAYTDGCTVARYPLDVVEVSHAVELGGDSRRIGPLPGSPLLTVMIDVLTRYLLGPGVSFTAPDSSSVSGAARVH